MRAWTTSSSCLDPQARPPNQFGGLASLSRAPERSGHQDGSSGAQRKRRQNPKSRRGLPVRISALLTCLGLPLLGNACGNSEGDAGPPSATPTQHLPDASTDDLGNGHGNGNGNGTDNDGTGSSEDGSEDSPGDAQPPASLPTVPVTNPAASANDSPFGTACTTDDDCEQGLECLLDSELFGGRLPNGLCTISCSTFEACEALDPFSACRIDAQGTEDESDDVGYCVQGCAPLDPGPKCHEREAAICSPFAEGAGACLPWCHSDADCDDGWHCNPNGGYCQEAAPEGKADGEPCDDPEECRGGICATLTSDEMTICSSYCSHRLDTFGCHQPTNASAPPDSICMPLTPYDAERDVGVCLPTCDADGDCAEGTRCLELDPEFESETGRAGLCFALPEEDSGEGDTAPDQEDTDGGTAAASPDAAAPTEAIGADAAAP